MFITFCCANWDCFLNKLKDGQPADKVLTNYIFQHETQNNNHSNNKTKTNINWQTYGQIGASRTINRGGVQLGASARGEQEGEYNMKSKQIQLLVHFIKGEGWGHPWLCIGFEACLGKWEETGRGRERARGRDIKATLSCVPRCCLEQNRLRTLRTEAVCSLQLRLYCCFYLLSLPPPGWWVWFKGSWYSR